MISAFYHKMINIVNKLFGSASKRVLKKYSTIVEKINRLEKDISNLSESELKNKTNYFKTLLSEGKSLDQILPEVFAVVREVSNRTIGLRHFDVQLIGGIVLHNGNIAEMKTGEGKTLVATLAAYLNSLDGKAVHIVTVNDYLAKRDSEWMGKIYKYLGLKVGCINSETNHENRAQEYESKINSGDPIALAEVVRDLHRNANQPEQSYSERQIYLTALNRLSNEYAAVQNLEKKMAKVKLEELLNQ